MKSKSLQLKNEGIVLVLVMGHNTTHNTMLVVVVMYKTHNVASVQLTASRQTAAAAAAAATAADKNCSRGEKRQV